MQFTHKKQVGNLAKQNYNTFPSLLLCDLYRYTKTQTHTNKASGQTSGSKSEWKMKLY
jgi:hypothetical protein